MAGELIRRPAIGFSLPVVEVQRDEPPVTVVEEKTGFTIKNRRKVTLEAPPSSDESAHPEE